MELCSYSVYNTLYDATQFNTSVQCVYFKGMNHSMCVSDFQYCQSKVEHLEALAVMSGVWQQYHREHDPGNKWNETGFRPPLCTYNWARRTPWGWSDDWDDTVLQTQDSIIRALAVWDRARYLSITEAPHNTNFHTWMGKKQFCFFQTAETGNRTPNSGVKGSGANHYPRAPAQHDPWQCHGIDTAVWCNPFAG